MVKCTVRNNRAKTDCMTRAASWQNQQNDCAPSEDSDQPGRPPSLIRVFTVCMKKPWVLSYPFSAQRRLWSDWADAQADLSLRWAHNHFVGFAMRRLTSWNAKFQSLRVNLNPTLSMICFMSVLARCYRLLSETVRLTLTFICLKCQRN